MNRNCLIWFRKDLRLYDNPALNAAKDYKTIYPIFIMDDEIFENKYLGGASLWWLENSLDLLKHSLNFYSEDFNFKVRELSN